MAENEEKNEGGDEESKKHGGGHGGGGGHKKKHGGHAEEHVNLERWLVSYADFMTLLFCVFTVLYAISVVDKNKMQDVARSVARAMGLGGPYEARIESSGDLDRGGVMEGTEGILDKSGKDVFPDLMFKRVAKREKIDNVEEYDYDQVKNKNEAASRRIKMEQVAAMLESGIKEELGAPYSTEISIKAVPGLGVKINLPETLTFKSGEAEIRASIYPALDKIGKVLERVNNEVVIEGHTDNIPISSARFPSNWELSSARSSAVLHYLLKKFDLSPMRFSAAGYGEFRPLAPNNSEENRSKNRRATIIILERGTVVGGRGKGITAPRQS